MEYLCSEELERLRRKFPAHFGCLRFLCPPEKSYPQTAVVYRLCINSVTLGPEDFEPSYVTRSIKPENTRDAGELSVSVIGDMKDVKKAMKFPRLRDMFPIKGTLRKKYGFAEKSGSTSHYHVWLYQESKPWLDFTEPEANG